ncbi:hypothetical protein O6P37_15900 [Mycobacterium sp. CPCC 205372]|uniref:Uncharacterized protein n=1 Tax=Mycobacterium hippophais TaxID=3016340 RepID=A0ABT4PUW1_9MYCO|nr:hypothetical protein [Mycobacterium hippophais]MCZ8380352.1 hypothetical protein [Mycobacterium hippophais]
MRRRNKMQNTEYEEPAIAVAAIQRELDRQVDAIRSQRSFSDAGRKTELAKSVLAARERVQQMRSDFASEREQRREDLLRYLFNDSYLLDGSDLIAHRDAQDRADQLTTSDEAMAMLNRANLHSDDSLASAVAEAAFNKGWTEVCERYATLTGKASALRELVGSHIGRHNSLADSVVFRIRNPKELSTANEARLRELAEVHAPGMGPHHWPMT